MQPCSFNFLNFLVKQMSNNAKIKPVELCCPSSVALNTLTEQQRKIS